MDSNHHIEELESSTYKLNKVIQKVENCDIAADFKCNKY